MPPIRAIPNSDTRSDQSDGRCAQTGQRSYGNAPPHCEASPPPAGLCPFGVLASESLPAAPVPERDRCHRPHRLAPAASLEDRDRGRETRLQAVVPPGPTLRPPFDRQRSHGLRSPRLPRAWPGHHRLSAAPSHICRDPRGWARSARPFFGQLLRAVEQHLIPVDPLQGVIAVGQLSPRRPKGVQFQPQCEPALHSFGGRKARRRHPPPDARDQDRAQGVQTRAVVVGGDSRCQTRPWAGESGQRAPTLPRAPCGQSR